MMTTFKLLAVNTLLLFKISLSIPTELADVVSDHNTIRRDVAQGNEKGCDKQATAPWCLGTSGSYTFPPAIDIMELQWDEDLATVAQMHADTCIYLHSDSEDRRTRMDSLVNSAQSCPYDNGYIGENIAWSSASPSQSVIDGLVEAWLGNEAINFQFTNPPSTKFLNSDFFCEYDKTNSSSNPNDQCKHFTQGIWAATKTVGCGFKDCSGTNLGGTFLVCNYYPGGNVGGQDVYTEGTTSCSDTSCPSGSCINHLCRDLSEPSDPCATSECYTLSKYELDEYNGQYSNSGGFNGKPFYSKSCDTDTCYIEFASNFNGGVWLLTKDHGTFNYDGWCTAESDELVDCIENKLVYKDPSSGNNYGDEDARIDSCSATTPETTVVITPPVQSDCIQLNSAWDSNWNGDYEYSEMVNGEKKYDKSNSPYGPLFIKYSGSRWEVHSTNFGGPFAVCDSSVTEIIQCGAGKWTSYQSGATDASATYISYCSDPAAANQKRDIGSIANPLRVESGDTFNMTEMHIILGLIVIVIVIMCAMIIGFCCYVKNQNKAGNVPDIVSENENTTDMAHFETINDHDRNDSNPQSTLKINVVAKTEFKNIPQTTPVSPLMGNGPFDS